MEFSDIDDPERFVSAGFPASILEETADFIVKSRERIDRIDADTICDPEEIRHMSEIIVSQAKKEEKRVIFLIIDLGGIISQLSLELAFIDVFYLKKDLQNTVSLLAAEGGFCASASDNRIILAIKARHSHSRNVMIHQMKQLLQKLCYKDKTIDELNVLTRIWPDDDTHIVSLLSDFFSDGNERG